MNIKNTLPTLGVILIATLGIILFVVGDKQPGEQELKSAGVEEKIYVALEGDGAVAVLDGIENMMIKKISLVDERTGTHYMPHNVQVSPDDSIVWVTANAMAGMEMEHQGLILIPEAHANEGHEDTEIQSDQLIAIDPKTDTIMRRIPIGLNQHLSHVVRSSSDATVFVAAQETDKIYVVDGNSMTTMRDINLGEKSGPHGMRLSPDNKTLFVAFMVGKALGVVDIASGKVTQVPLDGAAVQTAVTPDGSRVAVSVYDSKSVGVYDTRSQELSYIRLPQESQGPVQLYPTSDSRFVYVADQGVLGGRVTGNKVYKIDLTSLAIVETIEAGLAPHGVVLNDDNTRVFVSNLKGDSVSIIDTKTGKEISEIPVGKEPNGISVWSGKKTQSNAGMLKGTKVTVYKSPTCGCCGNYVAELKRNGAEVLVEEISDTLLATKKQELGVSSNLQSCHTSVMDGYVIEGHVPIEVIRKLQTERPAIRGVALPGMPAGSPGMSGIKTGAFTIKTLEGEIFGSF